MKRFILTALTGIIATSTMHAQGISIIPKPLQLEKTQGHYSITKSTAIRYETKLKSEAELLAQAIKNSTGVSPRLYDARLRIALHSAIELSVQADPSKSEAYSMTVAPKGIKIVGSDAAGVFYGMQSLLQLIPLEGEKNLPGCTISDQPRFGWRGMHLDVGRHMFAVKDIKKFIDWLAFHKMNSFHWHLTEDQGWRIEIKKYPKLTSIGGYRASTPPYGNRKGSDGTRYGGFYTQKEIKEVVAYATARHINVVPEIDMPGHMAAAIAAYPELGNDDIPNYNPEVKTHWGVHPYVLAPKEETFQWIDDVLTEVCALFPSEYIHIGGDEAPKRQWQQSKFAQSVMQREGCKNEHDLQSYFIGRVDKILTAKGRKLIGWDEIREGGLSPNATMMLWRGWDHAVASINEGHNVVMAPGSHTYFDHYQNASTVELAKGPSFECIGGQRTIESVYSFNPIPKQFRGTDKEKHVLGCQAQLWTEYMKTWDKVEYCAFPRIAAIAEVAWSQQDDRHFTDFMERLRPMLKRYEAAKVRHFNPFDPANIAPKMKAKEGAMIKTNLPTNDIHAPECAYDGNAKTYFWSARGPKTGDQFTVKFKKSKKGTITVKTGGGGKLIRDHLHNGVLESSTDGKNFRQLSSFKKGTATAALPIDTTCVRIRCTADQSNWLAIQEISITD